MNVDLQDLLASRADAIDPPRVDPLAVVAQGERLVRRRRRLAAGAAAVAVTVAVGATTLVLDVRGDLPPAQPANQQGARPLSYGLGQILHLGDREIDTGLDFLSLDITDDGAALTTLDGAIWFTDGTELERVGATVGGEVTPHGRLKRGRHVYWPAGGPGDWVINDSSGSLLAWLEYPNGVRDCCELVVYDSGRRSVVARQPFEQPSQSTPRVVAIAGREVFVSVETGSHDQLFRYGVDTGVLEPVDLEVFEAATRNVPRALVIGSSAEEGYVMGSAFTRPSDMLHVKDSRLALASPGRAARDGLFDPHTGQPIDMRVPGGDDTILYFVQWLDDDQFTLISLDNETSDLPMGNLYRCQIVAERCSVAIEASTWGTPPPYPLIPSGQGRAQGGLGVLLANQRALIDASE